MAISQRSKEVIKRAMENARGDDLERAKAAFRNCTETELDSEYGQSGKTRREILKEYESHRNDWLQASKELSQELE